MIVQALRSLVFYVLFLGQTAVLAIIVGLVSVVLRRRTSFGWAIAQYWGRSNLFLLRWVVGIRTEVRGVENIPEGPCIIAAKHMSDWDIFAILPHTLRPAFVAKKELMDIPFFGWAALTFDTIRIDRSRGGDAIPLMLEDARAALERGCRIIIFPEGTRTAPLAPHDYRHGIVRLYAALDAPVVPVGLNSGLFWGRNSMILWPGTATATFAPPIPPGLAPETFRERLVEAVESRSNALILEAEAAGLAGPMPPELHLRLQKLRAGEPPAAKARATTS